MLEASSSAAASLNTTPSALRNQPEPAPDRRQTLVRVVDPQMKPELGAGREHTIRLVGALVNQVVDQNTDVAIGPLNHQWLRSAHVPRGIQSGDQTLARCFFIARGAVDLAR